MVLHRTGSPLTAEDRPVPVPGAGKVLIQVRACAVCRTDLHIVDGELPTLTLPRVPGHEIVGTVTAVGPGVALAVGTRVGVPWLASTCGHCDYCRSGRENLCADARFTGCHVDGGYAEFALADHRYCLALPDSLDDVHAAPLLCAGLIGYRALRLTGAARRIGLYGFGAAAHLVAQLAIARAARCMPSCGRATSTPSASRGASARSGLGPAMQRRPYRSTPRSSSRRSARWCQRRSRPWPGVAPWSARAST